MPHQSELARQLIKIRQLDFHVGELTINRSPELHVVAASWLSTKGRDYAASVKKQQLHKTMQTT